MRNKLVTIVAIGFLIAIIVMREQLPVSPLNWLLALIIVGAFVAYQLHD